MKFNLIPLILNVSLLILTGHLLFGQESNSDYSILIEEAQQVKSDFIQTDPGLQKFFDESYGYVILPQVGKGGLIVGGAHTVKAYCLKTVKLKDMQP